MAGSKTEVETGALSACYYGTFEAQRVAKTKSYFRHIFIFIYIRSHFLRLFYSSHTFQHIFSSERIRMIGYSSPVSPNPASSHPPARHSLFTWPFVFFSAHSRITNRETMSQRPRSLGRMPRLRLISGVDDPRRRRSGHVR